MIDSQRARVRLRTVQSMVKTGVSQPEKIPPWIRSRAIQPLTHVPSHLAALSTTTALPDQRPRIRRLQDDGDYLLIVLDACRFDAFWDVFDNDLVGDVEPVASAGRDTFEYLQVIWPETYDLPYVSAAVPVNDERIDFDDTGVHHLYNGYQPPEHLLRIDDVWKEAWDRSLGACPPEPVLAQALEYRDADSLVVHYQQPHTPYIGEERELGHAGTEAAIPGQVAPVDKPIWDRIERGEISDDRLHELYWSNVERVRPSVLRTVDELLDEFESVVVTADHGEALGEHGVYAHPRQPQHPKVREVPWVEVSGLTRRGRRAARDVDVPDAPGDASRGVDDDLDERLQMLGYRSDGGA